MRTLPALAALLLPASARAGGPFDPPQTVPVGLEPSGLDAADLDGDGDLDLLAASSSGGLDMLSVFLNTGAGAFGPAMHFPTGGIHPDSVVARDFDGDGAVDPAETKPDSNQLSLFPAWAEGCSSARPCSTPAVRAPVSWWRPTSAARDRSTWKFQYWYRDPSTSGTGGAGFNLSDALSATFQP